MPSGLVGALNEENKVRLMFVRGKRKQRRYRRVIANLFSNKLQKLPYDY